MPFLHHNLNYCGAGGSAPRLPKHTIMFGNRPPLVAHRAHRLTYLSSAGAGKAARHFCS